MTIKYTDTFCVEFNTQEMPGMVVATQVTLKKRIMRPKEAASINLSEHPLYPKLAQYVFNNPPKGIKITRGGK